MKMSVPFAPRSMRVRYMSRSPVEYRPSKTLPSVERIRSWGSLARFSPQLVSITPISGCSLMTSRPRSCQKLRNCGQSCSGVAAVCSQRSVPLRSRRTSPAALAATLPGTRPWALVEPAGLTADSWEAVIEPP